jgi:hypothetical protein
MGCGTAFGCRGLTWQPDRGILPVHILVRAKGTGEPFAVVLLDAIIPNGLANISRFVPVFKKVFSWLYRDGFGSRLDNMNLALIIQDDEGRTIYGHKVLKRIAKTGMTQDVNIVRGILPECFITYLYTRFPETKGVRELAAGNKINEKLLEAVSEQIELGLADVVSMFRAQSQMPPAVQ